MKRSLAFLAIGLFLFACTSSRTGDAESQTEEAFVGTDCKPDALIPQATGERKRILQRAAAWVNSPLPYSMEDWHDGYRQDCSGFVGMSWGVSGNMTTANLPPQDDDGGFAREIAWSDLKPGDAIARAPNAWSHVGHVRLFAGKGINGQLCFWEQTMGLFDSGTQINVYREDDATEGGFVPIRKRGL